jgi:hypothetical protein
MAPRAEADAGADAEIDLQLQRIVRQWRFRGRGFVALHD